MKTFNIGRDKMDRIFKELKSKGYIDDIRVRNEEGRYNGVNYLVYENPENHTPENHTPENQCTGNPTTTNKEYNKELNILNTNILKAEGQSLSAKKPLDDIESIFK